MGAVLCGICSTLLAAAARAEGPATPSPPETSNHGADEPKAEQAGGAEYRQSLALYRAGDLQGALEQMRESYRLSQRPELLYNIARIEAERGDCRAALVSYRRYVELVPHGRYRAAADRAIAELVPTCGPPSATPVAPVPSAAAAPPAAPSPPITSEPPPPSLGPAPYWTTSRWIGWSSIAAGTLAGVGALYFRSRAVEARDDYQESARQHAAGTGMIDFDLEDEQDRQEARAVGLTVAASALVAGGVVVLLLAPAKSSGPSASVAVSPHHIGMRLSHDF